MRKTMLSAFCISVIFFSQNPTYAVIVDGKFIELDDFDVSQMQFSPPSQQVQSPPPPQLAVVNPRPAPRPQPLQAPIPAATRPTPPAVVVHPVERPLNTARLFQGPFNALNEEDKGKVAYTIAQKTLLSFLMDSTSMLVLKYLYKENLGNNQYLWGKTTERYDNFLTACKKNGKKKGLPNGQQFSIKQIRKLLASYTSVATDPCQRFQNESKSLVKEAWRAKLWQYGPQFYNLLSDNNKPLQAALQDLQKPIRTWIINNPDLAFASCRTLGHKAYGLSSNWGNVLRSSVGDPTVNKLRVSDLRVSDLRDILNIIAYMETLAEADRSASERAKFQEPLPGIKKVKKEIEEELENAESRA